LIFLSC